MMTVYSAPNTRAIRVIWVLEEIGAKAEIKSMQYPPRQHAPDYFAVNPTGMVPLLIDAGHEVVGLDADPRKVDTLAERRSCVEDFPSESLAALDGASSRRVATRT